MRARTHATAAFRRSIHRLSERLSAQPQPEAVWCAHSAGRRLGGCCVGNDNRVGGPGAARRAGGCGDRAGVDGRAAATGGGAGAAACAVAEQWCRTCGCAGASNRRRAGQGVGATGRGVRCGRWSGRRRRQRSTWVPHVRCSGPGRWLACAGCGSPGGWCVCLGGAAAIAGAGTCRCDGGQCKRDVGTSRRASAGDARPTGATAIRTTATASASGRAQRHRAHGQRLEALVH